MQFVLIEVRNVTSWVSSTFLWQWLVKPGCCHCTSTVLPVTTAGLYCLLWLARSLSHPSYIAYWFYVKFTPPSPPSPHKNSVLLPSTGFPICILSSTRGCLNFFVQWDFDADYFLQCYLFGLTKYFKFRWLSCSSCMRFSSTWIIKTPFFPFLPFLCCLLFYLFIPFYSTINAVVIGVKFPFLRFHLLCLIPDIGQVHWRWKWKL